MPPLHSVVFQAGLGSASRWSDNLLFCPDGEGGAGHHERNNSKRFIVPTP